MNFRGFSKYSALSYITVNLIMISFGSACFQQSGELIVTLLCTIPSILSSVAHLLYYLKHVRMYMCIAEFFQTQLRGNDTEAFQLTTSIKSSRYLLGISSNQFVNCRANWWSIRILFSKYSALNLSYITVNLIMVSFGSACFFQRSGDLIVTLLCTIPSSLSSVAHLLYHLKHIHLCAGIAEFFQTQLRGNDTETSQITFLQLTSLLHYVLQSAPTSAVSQSTTSAASIQAQIAALTQQLHHLQSPSSSSAQTSPLVNSFPTNSLPDDDPSTPHK